MTTRALAVMRAQLRVAVRRGDIVAALILAARIRAAVR